MGTEYIPFKIHSESPCYSFVPIPWKFDINFCVGPPIFLWSYKSFGTVGDLYNAEW